MNLFWFLAGVLTTLATLLLILPWLRKTAQQGSVRAPWKVAIVAASMGVAALILYRWLGHPELASQPNAMMTPKASVNKPKPATNAGSMNKAIASLEARLAKGGGSTDDWELLAKSYEFLGRPDDASKARARKLPPLPPEDNAGMAGLAASPLLNSAMSMPAAVSSLAVSGEVSLASALSGKAAQGATLFIVAKSVDSPGPPVAVIRSRVSGWPVKFSLDDSQSMVPGRNLSSAGRVKIEARISQSGQPLPAAGDLQGSSGIINPANHQSLKILIDKVIS